MPLDDSFAKNLSDAQSVPVRMMRVRHMRMGVGHRRVPMPVAVLSGRHRIVMVVMMTIVVTVRMFMFEGLVGMFVVV